jgi:single-stranded DNA-binding protein
MTSKTPITLYGNVGNDPETRTIPGKQVTKQFYDPIIDDMVEREFTTPEREVRTFSIAVSKKDPAGNDVTR